MPKAQYKPVLVPTILSLRTLLWSLALTFLAGALLWAYLAWGALAQSRARLSEPVSTTVEMPLYQVKLPPNWEAYTKADNTLFAFRRAGADIPVLFFEAVRDPGFAYHAIDINPAIALQSVEEDIDAVPLSEKPDYLSLGIVGSERLTVKPGITAMHLLFGGGGFSGEAVRFYSGDVRYALWSLHRTGDVEAGQEIRAFFRHLFENFDIPELREAINRPVVDSAMLTAEVNTTTHQRIARELALWRLFADRAEAEPEAALLPALEHYRDVLELLSSIRQERIALVSEDFQLYQRLLKDRQQDVGEWFIVLDKAVAMRDWDKARQQAKWIMTHATLTGERLDVRRAADILATQIPAEEGGADEN
ncbi:MAG: hypothetical protein ILO10_07365 [Kiritimatiellae bacterium]|nr:hypothetical protein [Kiritimatiellia bacterium]